jgi:putative membrane protein
VSDALSNRSIRTGAAIAAIAGVAGAAYLIFRLGFHSILDSIVSVGWSGFALLCFYGLMNFALLGVAWLTLAPPASAARAAIFCWGRAVRDSAGDVLPFSQFGGMVIGARAMMLRGIAAPVAFGSTIVDVTMEMIAQIAFILTGLTILLVNLPEVRGTSIVQITVLGIVVAVLLAGAFVVVQRRGFSFLERLARKLIPAAAAHAGELDRTINAIHARPLHMLASLTLHLCGWLSSAFGLWLALALTGTRLSYVDAIAIESLLCAARSAAVFIPGAIGVQEAGYAVMMPLFGLPAEIGIAVSLLKRAREIAVGIPVLLSWQVAEGHHALSPSSAALRGSVYE